MKRTLFLLIIVFIVILAISPIMANAEESETRELLKVGSTGDVVQLVQTRLFD